MHRTIESILFIDPQTIPARSCCVCGGAVYPPGYYCIRCDREAK